ncbi:hypothetical protein [Longitalea luteola]|uniref:hypothetical protein n=1 Tax=Longitalea luteola TaxID=2812563 RepID=UPI001A962E79|nr:hypothetical protein [Longitalea luteola]
MPFAVTIQWATCMELSIGNTAGLLSGAIWYLKIRDKAKLFDIRDPSPAPTALVGE